METRSEMNVTAPGNVGSYAATPLAPRWLDVELMGHGRIVGRAVEVVEFGRTWMRVESVCADGHVVEAKTVNPSTAVFGYSDVDENEARAKATGNCSDPSHPLYCSACGWRRAGDKSEEVCPICGDENFHREPRDQERRINDWVACEIVKRAGGEAIPEEGRSGDTDWMFEHGITREQRAEALAWALAVHRQRAGEQLEVPPRPAFLRDVTPETAATGEPTDSDGQI